jgi:hypothetical protein
MNTSWQGGVNAFPAGATVTETITSSVAGLNANSFNVLGAPGSGGNAGPFFAAAHYPKYGSWIRQQRLDRKRYTCANAGCRFYWNAPRTCFAWIGRIAQKPENGPAY